ncbi:hepatitis A virus cellular receptor 1 homolog isoform X7 [Gopherus flavomarginatus]|uniref:hepatitis A virus cellular receptor 1 homolog isoform X7 n=1 Tax=Gopherus flavomarginatus TaxID=286002 RepID=UPI0021CBF341|nr:hepatitis A virus cellular receptor 1 homolog isoform X7 [Gopherus flavomarginatus]
MAPYFILQWILMVLFTGLSVSGSPVRGVVGQNVTLPCKYRVNDQNDVTTMCWGRGSCPPSLCSQTILWTDGRRVTERQSSRYWLEGNLAQGDVSLTIVNAAEADGGMYCCRVEIPGWFNDQLTNLEVVIEKADYADINPSANGARIHTGRGACWNQHFCGTSSHPGFGPNYIQKVFPQQTEAEDFGKLSLIFQPRTWRPPEHVGSWGPCRREYLYDELRNDWMLPCSNSVAFASY